MRLGGHKMFLRPVLADLVVHFANSSTTCGNLGDWYTLWYNSSLVFMHTAFSMQIAGNCTNMMKSLSIFVWSDPWLVQVA